MPTTINASNTTGGAVVTGDGSGILELQSGGVTGITVNGPNVTVAGTLTATGGSQTPLVVGGTPSVGAQIRLGEATANGTNFVAVKAADNLAANTTFTLPTADGTSGQYLQTNGAGQLSFSSVVIPPGTPVGGIQYFAPSYAPGAAWLPCDGSVLTQASYPALYSAVGLISDGGYSWTSRSAGASVTLRGAAFGLSYYVIVGDSGTIRSSTTVGSGYVTRTSGTAQNLFAVAFGNGTFVAVGAAGAITTSTDAINWTAQTVGSNRFTDVIYANGLFVAVGQNSTIYTSPTGASGTWTQRTATGDFNGVSFGNGVFVAVAGGGGFAYSSDGVTWTNTTTSALGSTNFTCIAFGSGYFVAGSSGYLGVSSDGINWRAIPSPSPGDSVLSICFAGGKFVAVTNPTANTATSVLVSYGISGFQAQYAGGNGLSIRVLNNFFYYVGVSAQVITSPVYSYNTSTQFALPNGYAPNMNGQIPYIRVTA